MSADLRAAVLAGIDDEITRTEAECEFLPFERALKALRLLREDTEREHRQRERARRGYPLFCICRQVYPCPTLISRARVYAPEALAEMEAKK